MTRAATSDRFATGARIGDYQVDREVAVEATSVVYAATHVVLPRQAQLKVTHPGSRDAAVQLLREACILEALSHSGIPRVYECGVLSDRRPWSAIELVTGVGFDRFVGDGPLAVSDLVVALRDVADILRHAHERGVVHRRLAAGSIIRTPRRRGGYAICDWDDARTLDAESDVAVDPRDDVHALGLLAFHALTGARPEPLAAPATRQSTASGRFAEGFTPVQSAAVYCPAAPGELVSLVDQLLAEPVLRPTSHEVYDRALWLCDTLDLVPLLDRPRWTPPQGFVKEGAPPDDSGGFAIRISRIRS